ncbi:MAG: sugar ABC transporter permease, partial [Lachnospiraceae bacterium]|nr:sugar ABC transporter permease [Lachnospiraceae bacterium]
IDLFTDRYNFGRAIVNALILAALSVFIQLPLALGLALMLGKGIKGERFYLSVYFMPVLISAVVIGMLWEKIYNPIYGVLVKTFEFFHWTGLPPEGLLANKKTALLAVFIPTIWQYVGYHMLLMYAGVKGVSPELREAAMLDGATDGQVNRYVIIPAIKPIIKVSIIFAITGSLKSYDLIKIFAKDAHGLSYEVPSLLLVRYVFGNYGGMASAIAVMMIIMCFGFAILINWLFKERNPYGAK